MATTPILALENIELATPGNDPRSSGAKENIDNKMNAAYAALDVFAGQVTASFVSTFTLDSGSVGGVADNVGKEFGGGHYARAPRVIQEVVAFAARSGSGGVTRVDLQMTNEVGVFTSIFSNNVFKPAVSASLGNYGVATTKTFVTSSWPAGRVVKAIIDTAAGSASIASAQEGLTVQIFWKPSGSYSV